MVKAIKLETPKDACKVVQKLINRMFLDGIEIENAGRISNLLNSWSRCWELGKLSEIEERLARLESKEVDDGEVRQSEPQVEPTGQHSED
jgi:hypothetical protein